MSEKQTFRPQVEGLETRTALSAYSSLTPPAWTAALHGHPHHHHHLSLRGEVSGVWLPHPGNPDTGLAQELNGSGSVAPLGAVQVSGSLQGPGFVARGHATGTLTLSAAGGSITLRLVGQGAQPGFSGPPHAFTYTVTGGTGAYAGASGSGTVTLEERTSVPPPHLPPNVYFVPLNTFTLTFGPEAG
jgi:hypothetical protein